MALILILEDEKDMNEAVCEYLNAAGHQTIPAFSGRSALALFRENSIDLAVLDIMLPDMNGIEVLTKIRKESDIPILMLTAISDESTQVTSFDGLADAYITKPFSMLLLGKQIVALLRRSGKVNVPETLRFGEILVDFNGYKADGPHGKIDITPKEIEILRLLVEHKGMVLSRQQILDDIWELDADVMERVIDSYIKNLRKKLQTDRIVTVKGIGYKYEVSP